MLAGCTWSQPVQDFGIDLIIHRSGWELAPEIDVLLKLISDSSIIKHDEQIIKYPLSVKNYKDLIKRTLKPRVLILAILPKEPNNWLGRVRARVAFKTRR